MANDPKERSALRKAYLRRLGNPYASLQVPEDDFEIYSERQRAYRERGNPYAKLSSGPEEVEDRHIPSERSANSEIERPAALSKADFQTQCRDIFRPYIPHAEKGRLRAHHRRFIARHEARSPITRARLVRELRKYDISTLQGVRAYFNREREVFTDEKLKQIEHLVGDDD